MSSYKPYLKTTNQQIINHHFRPTTSSSASHSQLLQKTLPISQLIIIPSLLNKCCKNKNQLHQIHAHMTTSGLIYYLPLASKLVASFAASNHLSGSGSTLSVGRSIAYRIDGLDTYTWNTIIRGYLDGNDPTEAISVYNHVRRKGLKVDTYTLLYVVKACGFLPFILVAQQIHCFIHKMGFVSEIITQTALLNMYALFDEICNAQQVFDETPVRDLVMWNALISVYAQRNNASKVLSVLRVMGRDGVRLNGVTAVSILSACSSLIVLREGKAVHVYVIKNLTDIDVFVYNALIDMYSKCGSLLYACRVFQMMPMRNVVSWTSMINGYGVNNYQNEALALFKEMEDENIKADEITVLAVISVCSKLGSFELGEWIDHYYVDVNGFGKESSTTIANAMIDMHAKCGNIKRACQIFDGVAEKTLVSWSCMIQGLAMHGYGMQALVRFSHMQREGFKPDGVVFLSVLSGCSHSGLVDEGRKCFSSMIEDYYIEPWMEHYGCMVDLLCRSGLLNEAFKFVENMPIKPDMIMGRMLLGACQSQGNIDLACKVLSHLRKLGPSNSKDYIFLSNLYAAVEEWDNVKKVRKEMRVRGVTKQESGCSFIEMN